MLLESHTELGLPFKKSVENAIHTKIDDTVDYKNINQRPKYDRNSQISSNTELSNAVKNRKLRGNTDVAEGM